MIIYHFVFNLEYFYGITLIPFFTALVEIIGSFVRFFFIFLVGISSRILFINSRNIFSYIKRQLRRLLYLVPASLIISFVLPFFTDGVIWFGILHLISFVIIVLTLVVKPYILFFFTFLLLLGVYFSSFLAVIFGFAAPTVFMLDYFPVIPWVIPGILGFYLFDFLYRCFFKKYDKYIPVVSFLTYMGKNSLLIYLIHQPVILFFMLIVERSLRI